jgi:hypothetical protein
MNDQLPITMLTFRAVIPARLQPYLNVWTPGLEEYYRPVVDAFRVAVESIEPVVRRPALWFITFATSPCRMQFPTGILTFERATESINTTIENIALIDVKEVLQMEHPFRVVAILAELVHLLLNVKDETLTMQIVSWLYKGVVVRDGWYELP